MEREEDEGFLWWNFAMSLVEVVPGADMTRPGRNNFPCTDNSVGRGIERA